MKRQIISLVQMIKEKTMILDEKKLPQKYFEKICSIPHTSKNEKALSDYIVSEAKRLGYSYIQDEMYNVIVKIPATQGYEHIAPILLSGHMDMVGTKTGNSDFNFEKDALNLYIEDGILKAHDTTLGADDGVAVAYMLSLMADKNFQHPLIECVFTVQEEIGCCGSAFVDVSSLSSKRMIGLDSTGEHQVTVGNYCSDKVVLRRKYAFKNEKKEAYRLEISGFDAPVIQNKKLDIKDNAILYAAHWLSKFKNEFNLSEFIGGKGENFAPQSCQIVIVTDKEKLAALKSEFDSNLSLKIEKTEVNNYLSYDDSASLLEMILKLPNGPIQVNETDMLSSFLVGVISLNHLGLEIIGSTRCQNQSYNEQVINVLKKISGEDHLEIETSVRYRSWEYQQHSPLKELYRLLVKEYWHKDLEEVICPGGLEIADFIYKIPELDVLSIGPLAGQFHVPGEWLDLASFDRTYEMIVRLIENLK